MKSLKQFCLIASFLVGSTMPAHANAHLPAEKAVTAAIAAEKARGAALLAADTKALAKILADDFNYTHSNNHQETKASHIETFVKGLRYTKFETSSLRGQVITPDVVVLNGMIDQTKGTDGKMSSIHLLFQAVWRKNADKAWQLASLQTAAPPAAK